MLPHKKILSIPRYFNRAHSLAIRLSLAFALAIGLVVQPQLAIAEKNRDDAKAKERSKIYRHKGEHGPPKAEGPKDKGQNCIPSKAST